jgi:glutathione peroxidase-family protein
MDFWLYSVLPMKKPMTCVKASCSAVSVSTAKFLCVDGVPIKRYLPTTSPLAIEPDIKQALGL